MDIYEEIIHIIDVNVVFCLLPCIISLMIISALFKNRLKCKKALNIVRWFIIVYSAVTVSHYIIGMICAPAEYAFTQRATGPNMFLFWLMLLCNIGLPFTLLIKKLASKYWYVLLVAILIKSGFYFERYVIIVTSLHRDYFPSNDGILDFGVLSFLAILFLQGFILALLLLGIVEIIDRKTIRSDIF